MFKVFNPLTGVYQDAADQDALQVLWAQLVSATTAHFQTQPRIQGRYLYDAAWASAFDVAWAFYCSKTGTSAIDALATEGTMRLSPAHSVFNASTNALWSNTFAYIGEGNKLFHIKVRQGQVTDWYVNQGEVAGQTYEWVAFNLETGEPIEVYEATGERTLTKRNLLDPTTPTVQTHFMPVSEMPQSIQDALVNVPHKETVTAYSEKSYGLIVEFSPPIFVPETEWPADIKFEVANLREQESFFARVKAKDLVTITLVVTHEDGSETWEPFVLAEQA